MRADITNRIHELEALTSAPAATNDHAACEELDGFFREFVTDDGGEPKASE